MSRDGAITVSVAERKIGPAEPVFIVAEIGASHGGDADVAARLIEEAARCGVDAVKLQVISPDESYVPGTASYDIFKALWLPAAAVRRLMRVAEAQGVILFTTPGDVVDLQLLLEVGMPLVKISSGLLTNLPLIRRAAQTGLPMVISTGMSYLDEVAQAVRTAEEAGCRKLVLMHCTSLYSASAETLNLSAMQTLMRAFPYPVGYSDHYDGPTASLAATALGARILEKHFTLDRSGSGPDDHFAADPGQLKALVSQVREIERMLGSGWKVPAEPELAKRSVYRRCLVARRTIAAGEVLVEECIAFKRQKPGVSGLPPSLLPHVLGLRATRTIQANESIRFEDLTSELPAWQSERSPSY